jgi:hypothetical protein
VLGLGVVYTGLEIYRGAVENHVEIKQGIIKLPVSAAKQQQRDQICFELFIS